MTESFFCAKCGIEHAGFPLDFGFRLPDDVFAIHMIDRLTRVTSTNDLCVLDGERQFIRTILALPLQEQPDEFCWGPWVEVSASDYDEYVRRYDQDCSGMAGFPGRLANRLPGYPETTGLPVQVIHSVLGQRPMVLVAPDMEHPIVAEQREGIDAARLHDILEHVGYFR